MKSTWFPPYNPWLSGTWINYYYFGFVIVGTLTKLIGTVPSIAYNLVVPLIFALTGVGAFSVAFNLSGGNGRRALLAGTAALVFAVLVGNLGVVHLIRNKLIALGEISFPSTIPGFPNTIAFLRGLWRVVSEGAGLGVRPESWYWHPTRIIPAEAGNPVAEFPAFTFLYADLHAHMIAFPLTLFAIALALHWARAARPNWGSLLLGGLVIGALRATNTWDYPTYLVLGLIALGLGVWQWQRSRGPEEPVRGSQPRAVRWEGAEALPDISCTMDPAAHRALQLARIRLIVWRATVLTGLTVLLYLPYLQHFVAGYNSFQLWRGGTTPVNLYLWIYTMLLFPVLTLLVIRAVEGAGRSSGFRLASTLSLAGALSIGVVLFALGYPVALAVAPMTALAAVLFFIPGQPGREESVEDQRFLWLMVGTALALSLAVEVVVLEGDIGRMNTVFKFYLQVWILLSIAAAMSLTRVQERARQWRTDLRQLWWGVMAVLALGGALFLPFGIRARAIDRITPATGLTLDGMAFIQHASISDGPDGDIREISLAGDHHAIRWMQQNIEGSPVIMEGLGRREYLWANRVSIYTGLPAVVGWRWHQAQQRAGVGGDLVSRRREVVNVCYNTTDVSQAEEILDRYAVRYVYVGEYERAYYDQSGLDKFRSMVEQGLLRVAYEAHGVTLYEVMV
jgi:YYY domain-containing protein